MAEPTEGRIPDRAWWSPALFFVACLGLYAANLGHPPHPDELYHILAAKGLLATGEPRILDGVYERGLAETWLVAQGFQWLGESLFSARLPSAVIVALTAVVVLLWTRAQAGRLAGWLAGGLFALSPFAIEIAQLTRFYALQTFAFLLAALAIHHACRMTAPWWMRAPPVLAGLATLWFAATLQPTSLMGAIGLFGWVALVLGVPWLLDPEVPGRHKLLLSGGVAVLGLAALGLAFWSGMLEAAWRSYRSVPLFNRNEADQFWYYLYWYALFYPVLLLASPLLVLAGLARRPGPVIFALTLFLVALLLNSLAAPKNLRYLVYAQPFLFMLWGIGLAAVLPPFWRYLRDLGEQLGRLAWLTPRWGHVLVCLLAALLVLANPAWLRSAMLLLHVPLPGERPPNDWPATRDRLLPLIEGADAVVASEELGALYFLGRADYVFNPSKLSELPRHRGEDFASDFRTGLPVIGSAAALSAVLDCHESGVFLTTTQHWRRDVMIPPAARALIMQTAAPLDVDPKTQIMAFAWKDGAPGDDCPARLAPPADDADNRQAG